MNAVLRKYRALIDVRDITPRRVPYALLEITERYGMTVRIQVTNSASRTEATITDKCAQVQDRSYVPLPLIVGNDANIIQRRDS